MSAFEPTTFKLVREGNDLNVEQLACRKVFKVVSSLKIFEVSLFADIENYPTNHLLNWCQEVMAAQHLGCFDSGDFQHDYAKRVLTYNLKRLYVFGQQTAFVENVPFKINWSEYLQHKRGTPATFAPAITLFSIEDENNSLFIQKVQRSRDSWGVSAFLEDVVTEANPIFIDDVKVGEDTGATPAVVEPAPNAIEQILAEPLNLQGGVKRKYYGRKTKAAAHKTQRQHKTVQNARRVEGSKKVLAKGYNVMPKDRALQISAGVFVPTIFIDTINAHNQFNQDFPPAERQHGFMVSCKGVVLYWNTLTQDFGPALVDLP